MLTWLFSMLEPLWSQGWQRSIFDLVPTANTFCYFLNPGDEQISLVQVQLSATWHGIWPGYLPATVVCVRRDCMGNGQLLPGCGEKSWATENHLGISLDSTVTESKNVLPTFSKPNTSQVPSRVCILLGSSQIKHDIYVSLFFQNNIKLVGSGCSHQATIWS